MALTQAALRLDVIDIVEGNDPRNRPYTTTLTGAPGAAPDTLPVQDGDAWQTGDIAEVVDATVGNSLNLVLSVSTNTLTVTRDVGRVTRVGDYAGGELVRKNPRFSYDQIDQALSAVLQELNPRVFALLTEDIAYTTQDFYDVADTAMENVLSAWYLDDGDMRTPYYYYQTDPANDQPTLWLAGWGYSGTVHISYQRAYAAVTEMPDRLGGIMVAGSVYRLLGGSTVWATTDAGKRTDRTVQGGQEARDSYWFFREFTRLMDLERVYLMEQIKRFPKDIRSQRSRRFRR